VLVLEIPRTFVQGYFDVVTSDIERLKKARKAEGTIQQRPADDVHANCRVLGQVLDRIGDKWTGDGCGRAVEGADAVNALLRLIGGVSHRMLTLRGLEQDGLVKRTVCPTVSRTVEYELTDIAVHSPSRCVHCPFGLCTRMTPGAVWPFDAQNNIVKGQQVLRQPACGCRPCDDVVFRL
jgi:DNA-binding HxlR family transcriptional regulator